MIRLRKFSYRFAEQVLNSRLSIKQEIEKILTDPKIDLANLSRPEFNSILEKKFVEKGWESQPSVFNEPKDPAAKMDFLKTRIGIEVALGLDAEVYVVIPVTRCCSPIVIAPVDMDGWVLASSSCYLTVESG